MEDRNPHCACAADPGTGLPRLHTLAPNYICEQICAQRHDPVSGELDPVAVERMYMLAMFYKSTLRADQAQRCWDTILTWFYGHSIRRWAAGTLTKHDRKRSRLAENKEIFSASARPWAGYSLFRVGQRLNEHRHKEQAKRVFQRYLKEFEGRQGEESAFTRQAKAMIRSYDAGG